MNTRVIGIDLGVTAAHKAIVYDPARGAFVGKPWSFRPYPAELDRLLQRAQQECSPPVDLAVVLEATGMAWYPVGVYLHDRGARVYRVNGRKTRDLRKVLQRHAGSDRIDCRVLAQLYLVAHQQLDRGRPVGRNWHSSALAVSLCAGARWMWPSRIVWRPTTSGRGMA